MVAVRIYAKRALELKPVSYCSLNPFHMSVHFDPFYFIIVIIFPFFFDKRNDAHEPLVMVADTKFDTLVLTKHTSARGYVLRIVTRFLRKAWQLIL